MRYEDTNIAHRQETIISWNKKCVKAQDKNGPAVDANTHLEISVAKIFLDTINYLNRWSELCI